MAIRTIKNDNFTWYYLTNFSDEESNFLKSNFKFHPLDLKDCAGEIQRSKIDIYKNYLFLILQIPILSPESKKVAISQIYFFVGKKFLITISSEKNKSLNNLFYRMANSQKFKEEAFSKGTGYLLYRILDTVLRSSWSIHGFLNKEVSKIQEYIDTRRWKELVFEAATSRRIIIDLKAIIDPQKIISNTLSKVNVEFIEKEMLVYFDDIDDFIEKNWFTIESYRDFILSLQEINESLISYKTNQVMKILTVVSVSLMPLTLLSGIYGMNIDLPFDHSPHFIWFLFGALILIISIIFIFLKKKDWI